MNKRITAIAIIAALALASCGSSESSAEETTSKTAAPTQAQDFSQDDIVEENPAETTTTAETKETVPAEEHGDAPEKTTTTTTTVTTTAPPETTTTTTETEAPEPEPDGQSEAVILDLDLPEFCWLLQNLKGMPLFDAADMLSQELGISFDYNAGYADVNGTALLLFRDMEASPFNLFGVDFVYAELYYDESGVYSVALSDSSYFYGYDVGEVAKIRVLSDDCGDNYKMICDEMYRAYSLLSPTDEELEEESVGIESDPYYGYCHFYGADYAESINAEIYDVWDEDEEIIDHQHAIHRECYLRIEM